MVAPLLDTRQKSIVELFVDLVELRHFEEDGFYLGHGKHWLGRCSSSLQRLHGLRRTKRADIKDVFQTVYCARSILNYLIEKIKNMPRLSDFIHYTNSDVK